MTSVSTQLCGMLHSDTTLPLPSNLLSLFEGIAAAPPDAIAVRFGLEQLSYRELEHRSNQLAHRLRRLGIGRNHLAGLLVDRSPSMVVALLGILKAGGAYLPLDPFYPVARIESTLIDAGVSLLISETAVLARLQLSSAAPMFLLDALADEEIEPDISPPLVEYEKDDTAYVIFTSGSTGKPKGVDVSRGSLENLLLSLKQVPGMSDASVMLAVTSIAFDIAAAELFLPLLAGGRIELAGHEEAADATRLLEKMEACCINIMQATPVTWRLLILAGWTGTLPLTVWCGGEEMSEGLAQDLLQRSNCVWNLYGPTETTIWSTLVRLEKAEKRIPLGTPIANTSVYILDEEQQPVDAEVPGELYIGGVGLAKGYWQRPDLTEAAFLTIRFSDGVSRRLYKTGDRARLGADGRLEYLGRLDRQVKLHGFRIELGEIEYVARNCAGVEEVVVVSLEDARLGNLLAAFAVKKPGAMLEAAQLRLHLVRELPAAMVPSAIRIVDSLPTTPNGKLDRKQIASLNSIRADVLDSFDEPLDGIETRVAALWCEALEIPVMGRLDNFFALGGDSLLAAQVEVEMSHRIDSRCSVGSMLRCPTIASYAAFLSGEGMANAVLLHAGETIDDRIFWMDNPERLPRLAGLLGDRPFYSMLLDPRDIASEAPHYPMEKLAARMVDHILKVQTEGKFSIGGFCQNALLAYEVSQQLRSRGFEVPLLIMIDPAGASPSTASGPFFSRGMQRVEREWFHLTTMLGLRPSEWAAYVRQRYEGLRFELDGQRWRRAARTGSGAPDALPRLSQALFASTLTYVPGPSTGRALFIEPTLRPQPRNDMKTEGWRQLVEHAEWCSVAGDHLGLFAVAAVYSLAATIRAALDRTREESAQ